MIIQLTQPSDLCRNVGTTVSCLGKRRNYRLVPVLANGSESYLGTAVAAMGKPALILAVCVCVCVCVCVYCRSLRGRVPDAILRPDATDLPARRG